jgi:hypothetical protein
MAAAPGLMMIEGAISGSYSGVVLEMAEVLAETSRGE